MELPLLSNLCSFFLLYFLLAFITVGLSHSFQILTIVVIAVKAVVILAALPAETGFRQLWCILNEECCAVPSSFLIIFPGYMLHFFANFTF